MLTIFLLVTSTLFSINNAQFINCPEAGPCACPNPSNTPSNASTWTCTLNCQGNDWCKSDSSVLTCRSGSPCVVYCRGQASCQDAIIQGSDATHKTIVCDGDSSCGGNTKIHCGTGDCRVNCTGNQACHGAFITAPNANSFQCNGCDPLELTAPPEFSAYPTSGPTNTPTTTISPTKAPSNYPSMKPTQIPSKYPTKNPTNPPTTNPLTTSPTKFPSAVPTNAPNKNPTQTPTDSPNTSPTESSSDMPSLSPTYYPSNTPSQIPSALPTNNPMPRSVTNNPSSSAPIETSTTYYDSIPSDLPTPLPTTLPTIITSIDINVEMSSKDKFKINDSHIIAAIVTVIGVIIICIGVMILYRQKVVIKKMKQLSKHVSIDKDKYKNKNCDKSNAHKKQKDKPMVGLVDFATPGFGKGKGKKNGEKSHDIFGKNLNLYLPKANVMQRLDSNSSMTSMSSYSGIGMTIDAPKSPNDTELDLIEDDIEEMFEDPGISGDTIIGTPEMPITPSKKGVSQNNIGNGDNGHRSQLSVASVEGNFRDTNQSKIYQNHLGHGAGIGKYDRNSVIGNVRDTDK